MKKLLYISQHLLKCTLIFFIAFIWLKFCIDKGWLTILLSIAITLSIELVSILLSRKKNAISSLKLIEKEKAEDMYFSLINSNAIDFLYNLFKTRFQLAEKKKNYIKIKKENEENYIVYPVLSLDILNASQIANIMKGLNKENFSKLILICFDYDSNCDSLLKSYNKEIIILNKFETYATIFKEFDYYPQITHKFYKNTKQTFKQLIAFSLNKSRSKGYIISAIILFITSFFVKLNLYYCIIASVLLILALVSYINPQFNQKQKTNLF